MGVTATRLLTIGTPYFSCSSSATATSRPARRTILARTRSAVRRGSRSAQSSSEIPIVTARTSRFSDLIMWTVSRISSAVMKTTGRLPEVVTARGRAAGTPRPRCDA